MEYIYSNLKKSNIIYLGYNAHVTQLAECWSYTPKVASSTLAVSKPITIKSNKIKKLL